MKHFIFTVFIAAIVAFIVANTVLKPSAEISESLYDRVMRTGTIRCGYAVIEPGIFKDPNTGAITGIVHDLVEKAASNLKLKVEWTEEYGVGELVAAIENKRVDMICSGIWLSSARARLVDATDPLFFLPSTIWMQAKSNNPSSFNDSSVTFSAIEGSTSARLVGALFPKADLLALPEMNSVAENLLVVASKKADATILPIFTGERFNQHNPDQIRNALKTPLRNDPAVMLLPRDEHTFKSMINAALSELAYTGYTEQLIKQYNPYDGAVMPAFTTNIENGIK